MKVHASAEEAVALLRASGVLPGAVHEPRLVDGGLEAAVDPGALSDGGGMGLRLAAALLGRIPVAVRDGGLDGSVWTLRFEARLPAALAGALPDPSAMLAGFLREQLSRLGDALLELRPDEQAQAGGRAVALLRLDTAALLGLAPRLRLRLATLSISAEGVELDLALAEA